MADIKEQIKKEKEEFEKAAAETLEEQQPNVESTDLVPVADITNATLKKIFTQYYPPEVLEHLKIDKNAIEGLTNALKLVSKNVIKMAGPIICTGPKCYTSERCPLQKSRVAPIGHSCSVELMLIDVWENEYMDELNVDSHSKVELDLLHELIEADLIDWRTSNEIAKGGLYDWNIVGVSQDGKPFYRKEEAAAFNIKMRIKTRKDRIRDDLMATRKMQAKFGLAKKLDPSKIAAELQNRYDKVIKNAHIIDEEMKEPKDK